MLKKRCFLLLLGLFFGITLKGQITGMNYGLKYNSSNCTYEVYMIVVSGGFDSGDSPSSLLRLQGSSQVTVVAPANSTLTNITTYNPINDSGLPGTWEDKNKLNAPTAAPGNYFVGFIEKQSPPARYLGDVSPGDEILLFSFEANIPGGDMSCGEDIRLFINGTDPSSAELEGGADFANSQAIGFPGELYIENAPRVLPEPLDLSAIPMCSMGLEIDLTVNSASCRGPFSYEWSGPNGFSSTDEDVAINPATSVNNGTYTVTVTDNIGCSTVLSVDATTKPEAGSDVDACAGGSVNLQGSEPIDGTWTAEESNPSGSSIVNGSSGAATVTFDGTAVTGAYAYIYTFNGCSDTMMVNVTNQDAGPDPGAITCNTTGTATLSAVGTGTWSVDPSSPGTADFSDVNNPNSTVNNFSVGGVYTLNWTENGCTDFVQIVVNENCGCPIAGNSLTPPDPAVICGTSGNLAMAGSSAGPIGGDYLWQINANGAGFVDATGSNATQDYITDDLSAGIYVFRRIYTITSPIACSDTSNVVTLEIVDIPAVPTNLTASDIDICLGETVDLSVDDNSFATFTWSSNPVDAGLSSSTTNSTQFTPSGPGVYSVSVTQTVDGCESAPATIDITVSDVPEDIGNGDISGSNPTACSVSDGSITISNLSGLTTYTLLYTDNGNPVSVSITTDLDGVATVTNLDAGIYTNFQLQNAAGCQGNPNTTVIELTEPDAPDALSDLTASPNPACVGDVILFTAADTISTATYNWSASSPNVVFGTPVDSTITATISDPGLYTVSVTITIDGCTSAPTAVGVRIDPAPDTPDLSDITTNNPTACGGTDGSIIVGGLEVSASTTINYKIDGVDASYTAITNGSGELTIPNLGQGTYTDFSITNFAGCTSGVFAGPVDLSEPGSPDAPANLTADQTTVCLGETVNFTVDNNPGATFNWSANSADAGLVASTTNTTSMTATVPGVYTISVSQTLAGCTSPATSIEITVLEVPADVDPGNVSTTNPTVCGSTDGIIQIGGFTASTDYTLMYDYNTVTQTVAVTTNSSGQIILNNLPQGTYTNFTLSNAGGCSSNNFIGPVRLDDPNTPDPPADITAVPNPACVGETVTITVTEDPAATYVWTSSQGAVVGSGASVTYTIPGAGEYIINVTQTIAGCTSPPAQVTLFARDSPLEPDPADFSTTNPTACLASDGFITIANLTPNESYFIDFDSAGVTVQRQNMADALGNLIVPGLPSGTYSNFVLTNFSGCSSPMYTGSVSLSDPGAPDAPSNGSYAPDPACIGTEITVNVSGEAGAIYTWSAASVNAGLDETSTGSSTTMNATQPGTYAITVFQTVSGCVSPTATIDVTVSEIPTDITAADLSKTDPTGCGAFDGTISVSGLNAGEAYTIGFDYNGNAETVNITADGSGVGILTGRDAGTYTDFVVINSAGCASNPFAGPLQLDGPVPPPAPSDIVAVPNPACLGDRISVSVTGEPGAIFTWTASSPNAGLVTSNGSIVSMTPTAVGTYTIQVTQTTNSCTSLPATIDVVVDPLPPTPSAGAFSSTNPTACLATDGTISIAGYTPNSSFTVDYLLDGVAQSTSITSNSGGMIMLTGLGAGSYSQFSITGASGCGSAPFGGPIVLSEPGSPDAPTGLTAIPNPVCLGGTVDFSVSGVAGATFNWSISNPDGGLGSSTTTSNRMTPSVAGEYTITVSQTLAGCTSPPATVQVYVLNDCYNPDFGATYVDVPLTGNLSTNDMERPGSTYGNVQVVGSNPSGCAPSVSSTGSYTFTCSTLGEYNYTVDVCFAGDCSSMPLVITVLDSTEMAINPPIVNHDYTYTNNTTPVTIDIESNDKCQIRPGCSLEGVTLLTPPSNGAFSTGNNTYTPNAGFVGIDSFEYESCELNDAGSLCDQEWVYVRVYPGYATAFTNAMDDYNQTPLNTPLVESAADGLLSNDIDVFGNAQTIAPFTSTAPGMGTLELSADGSYTFTPETGYLGPVDFPYATCRVSNPSICDSATLHILVQTELIGGNLSSLVWYDGNGDGRYETSEPGIEDVEVILYNNDFEEIDRTVTDENGIFDFIALPEDDYYLEFINPDTTHTVTRPNVGDELNDSDIDDTFGPGTTDLFYVSPGTTLDNVKAGYFECVRVGDNVWYDVNMNDLHDEFENGINGLVVELFKRVDGTYVLWDQTKTAKKPNSPSDDGWYEFCVAPGTYYIRILIPPAGLVTARPNIGNNEDIDSDITGRNGKGTSDAFTLVAGRDKLDLGAGYYPEAQAGNLVWMDENNDGIQNTFEERVPGVKVEVIDVHTQEVLGTSTTNDKGVYMIDNLEKKEVYMKFYPPGGLVATEERQGRNDKFDSDVDGSYGENTTRMIMLKPGRSNDHMDMGLAFSVLPVTWLSVDVKNVGNAHEIFWKVADQVNVEGYEVQLMKKGELVFTPVMTGIKTIDNHDAEYKYVYEGLTEAGEYSYRVKQYDYDGSYSYSDIKSIYYDGQVIADIYPNPTSQLSFVEVEAEKGEVVNVKVIAMDGREVISINQRAKESGILKLQLDLTNVGNGTYNVVINNNNRFTRKKLMKLK